MLSRNCLVCLERPLHVRGIRFVKLFCVIIHRSIVYQASRNTIKIKIN